MIILDLIIFFLVRGSTRCSSLSSAPRRRVRVARFQILSKHDQDHSNVLYLRVPATDVEGRSYRHIELSQRDVARSGYLICLAILYAFQTSSMAVLPTAPCIRQHHASASTMHPHITNTNDFSSSKHALSLTTSPVHRSKLPNPSF